MDKQKRDKIIQTLKKLQAMAEKGCNEQEVETAARLLRKQLDKYGLTMADLAAAEEKGGSCERQTYKTGRKDGGFMDRVMHSICQFCDCKGWYYTKNHWEFMGFPNDIMAACVLSRLIESASIHEWKEYLKTIDRSGWPAYRKRQAWVDFFMGFMIRVSARLDEITKERKEAAAVNALVVRKKDIIKQEMHDLGIHLHPNRDKGRSVEASDHYKAGYHAGGRVALNSSGSVE